MIQSRAIAFAGNRLRGKIAVAASLLFAMLGLCTALAQTPTSTPTTTATTTVTTTATATTTQSPTATVTLAVSPTVTSTPPATPTITITQAVTLTPNASASPTVTKTRTPTRTRTPTHAVTATGTPGPPAEVVAGYIPAVGSLPGNFGSFFRTSIQLLNPSQSPSSRRLIFHAACVSGQLSDPSVSWTLAPGQVVSYPDFVATLGLSGLGSVDVTVGDGQTVPIVITRIFDDAGAGGTTGFTEPLVHPADVPGSGSGFLVGPSDVSKFRFNVGIRTLDSPVSVMATVRDSAGNVLHSVTRSYDANLFVQTSAADFLGFSLGNDQSIEIAFTGGGLIAYGATVDNVTNDPSAQFLPYITGTPVAQGTGTSRRGSSAPLKLAVVLAMLGVGAAIVIGKR